MGHWHTKHWKLGLSSSATAVSSSILEQVETQIKALGLSGVATASVVTKKFPWERVFSDTDDSLPDFPGVIITPEPQSCPPGAGSNVQDDIVYGVGITLIDKDTDATLEANIDRNNYWIEQIRKSFHNKRLSNVSTVYTCHVTPDTVVWESARKFDLYAGHLMLRFISRETR